MTRLTRASIRSFAYRHAGLADVTSTIREVGQRVGRAGAANRLASTVERDLGAIRARVADRPRPNTALVFDREPGSLRGMYASGGVGFLHDLLVTAGGRNAFADVAKEGLQVSSEVLLARAPEVILEIRPSEGWAADRCRAGDRTLASLVLTSRREEQPPLHPRGREAGHTGAQGRRSRARVSCCVAWGGAIGPRWCVGASVRGCVGADWNWKCSFQLGVDVHSSPTASDVRASGRKTAWKGATARGAGGPHACVRDAPLEGRFSHVLVSCVRDCGTRLPARGARRPRRDDREYALYLREEQRRPPGCPARKSNPKSRTQDTRARRAGPNVYTQLKPH